VASEMAVALGESGFTLKGTNPKSVIPGETSGRVRAEQTVEVVRNGEGGTKQLRQSCGEWTV